MRGGAADTGESAKTASCPGPGRKSRVPAVKVCRHCGETKPVSAFPRNRATRDGLSSWCRLCHYAATRKTKQTRRAEYYRREKERAGNFLPDCDDSLMGRGL